MLFQKSEMASVPPNMLCYCNMGFSHPDRFVANRHFIKQPWCTVNIHGLAYERYCDSILNHAFNVSPRGNGLDCHRTWETLYLGRYPVMRRMYSLERLYADLPVVFVDCWEDVTREYLTRQAAAFAGRTFNYDKLKFSYWQKYVEGAMRL